MAIHYRSQGIIFQKKDVGEADRLFSIYTKDFGRLDLLARAERKIKSKLRGGLELFYLSEVEFIQGKTYKTLTDTILIDSYQGLRKSLEKLAEAHKISNILDRLMKEEESDGNIWELVLEVFGSLDSWREDKENWKLVYYYFLWNFFSILGYQPEVRQCVICQQKLIPDNLYFSPERGGVICRKCFGVKKIGEMISPETVKILRILLKRNWPVLSKIKIKEQYKDSLITLSESYFSYIFSRKSL